ncbi:MAG: hypothetical protein IPM82_13620 [Saprospiraceae bacterium]|nr:hypothetical protein [Saprospiraceae bacterium]
MKKLIFCFGLLIILFMIGCIKDNDLQDYSKKINGRVSEKDSGIPLEGIGIQIRKYKFCLIFECNDREVYGETSTSPDGTFNFTYYGSEDINIQIDSPMKTVLDGNGHLIQVPRYPECELFEDTSSCYSSDIFNATEKFLEIKMIKRQE